MESVLGLAVSPLLLSAMALIGALAALRRLGRRSADAAAADAPPSTLPGPAAGLVSRAEFDESLHRAAQRCDAQQGTMTLLFINLDGFSQVNETCGHAAGDAALAEVAMRVHALSPRKAAATRLGGDEFLLLLENDLAAAEKLAAALLRAVAVPVGPRGQEQRLTASIGIAAYPTHGAWARLPVLANTAMRDVKHSGGNAWAVFVPQMAVDQRAQAALLADLRLAVGQRQFELFYQPKVDARTLEVTAAEALLRWHHPVHGIISPSVFIPLAERHGLIGEIGNWVIDEACAQAGRWRAEGLRMRVAINLSAYQMRQDDLVPRLVAQLRQHHLQPERFTVEITESLALENTKATQRTFQRLRQAGLHVAIDDFGAGATSLAYLHQLPVSELKMDMSLVRELETSADARAVAEAVIRLAHTLQRHVVAEGVETAAQRDWLVQAGCDELQGYLFAKPMPALHLGLWAQGFSGEAEHGFSPSLFKETAPAVL